MIAELSRQPFMLNTLKQKIVYHQKKIESGYGEVLFYSSLVDSLSEFLDESIYVSTLNKRVKHPYHEVSINLQKDESLDNNTFATLAKDYLEQLGYKNTNYCIIKHNDKDHSHLHILFTTIDYDGIRVSDSNIIYRSEAISRKLEKLYNLKAINSKSVQANKSLGEIKAREYYVSKALKSSSKSYSSKAKLNEILQGTPVEVLISNTLTNKEIENMIGSDIYMNLTEFLTDKNFFKPLYKEELLKYLDAAYNTTNSKDDFIEELNKANIYMRMVSDKGNHIYIYGLKDASIYFKDKSLPLKYRYTNLNDTFQGKSHIILDSEQKNQIYTVVMSTIDECKNISELKQVLINKGIDLIEHKHSNDKTYGISFRLCHINDAVIFKASEISRRLSYENLSKFYSPNNAQNQIQYIIKNNTVMGQLKNESVALIPMLIGNSENAPEDFLSVKKKKKKKQTKRNMED